MSYLILPSRAEAEAMSHDEAIARGCMKSPDDVTRYWWAVVEHPSDGRAAVELDEETALQSVATASREQLDEDGWFPKPPS